MLYIQTKDFTKQLDLIEWFASSADCDVICWFFPESKHHEICDLESTSPDLIEGEPVTTYGGGLKPIKTKRVKLDLKLSSKFRKDENSIRKNVDSIVVYRENEKTWLACVIEHEGICMVQDDSLETVLKNGNFHTSRSAPSWW